MSNLVERCSSQPCKGGGMIIEYLEKMWCWWVWRTFSLLKCHSQGQWKTLTRPLTGKRLLLQVSITCSRSTIQALGIGVDLRVAQKENIKYTIVEVFYNVIPDHFSKFKYGGIMVVKMLWNKELGAELFCYLWVFLYICSGDPFEKKLEVGDDISKKIVLVLINSFHVSFLSHIACYIQ